MNRKYRILLGMGTVIVCMLFGCNRKNEAGWQALSAGEELSAEEEPSGQETAFEEAFPVRDQEQEETGPEGDREETKEKEEKQELLVHICGAVASPGVYRLNPGSRVYQALEAAGGLLPEADQDYLNQADALQDGVQLYVPTKEEAEALQAVFPGEGRAGERAGLVNINTASEEALCTLSGIGSGKARSIIAYRTENGNFEQIEDIMKVEGIKEGLFARIKDSITV